MRYYSCKTCDHLLCRSTDEALKFYGSDNNEHGEHSKQSCSQYKTAVSNGSMLLRALKMKDLINIRSLGVLFFILASIFCIYEICVLGSDKPQAKRISKTLKLVQIFSRHGDRAPSDSLPKEDRHNEKVHEFWPHGLTNLTDIGRLREFMVGLETRRHYNNYLDYDSSKILALSSPINRCRESLEFILKGLYNIAWTPELGRSLIRKTNCTNCLPHGSGFPNEWERVPIDLKTVPALSWQVLDNCKYRKDHPSPIDSDLMASPDIKSLKGVYILKDMLMRKYGRGFNEGGLNIWSTVMSELNLIRTESTINYTDHYRDWINQNISVKGDSILTLFDLYEQVNVLAFRDRVVDEANYIQSGPLITSLIESQMVALGMNYTSDHSSAYKDKKMIIYMTHDTILQMLFNNLGIMYGEGSYEDRFHKMYKSSLEAKFLANLKMCSYGLSIRFELWEQELEGTSDKFSYVQASLYNQDDPKQHIEYKPIEFGSICRRMFSKKYKKAGKELTQFYNSDFKIDPKFNCPFGLLRNLTAQFMIDDKKIDQLCQ